MLSSLGSSLTSLLPGLTQTGASGANASPTPEGSSFSDVFKSAIQGVDDLQGSADTQVSALLSGSPNTDVNHVMVSVEKADVAFQLMMQVRNKIVSAYQDIEKMQF